MSYRRLWVGFTLVVIVSFSVLIFFGRELFRAAPPIPDQVVAAGGQVVFTGQEIRDGQNVWQSIGGQELGSVWGHGAYVAPDWSADTLHRICLWLADRRAREAYQSDYASLSSPQQAFVQAELKKEIRTNRYDPETGTLVLSDDMAKAVDAVGRYYAVLFGDGDEFPEDVQFLVDGGFSPAKLRGAYAMPSNTIRDAGRQHLLNAFFFWASWACGTERPTGAATTAAVSGDAAQGTDGDRSPEPAERVTYTNNWPGEPLIGNRPSGQLFLWSAFSIVVLLAGVGALGLVHARQAARGEPHFEPPQGDPLHGLQATPSMKATLKYFWVVVALLVVQVGLGGVTAHYGVEGEGFYGIPLAQWIPYSVTRTWHTQLGIFWIATAWLATGLYIAPAVSGYEPKFQRAGVNFLLVCLVTIVVGTLFGTWYATRQQMSLETNFWFGHQGYEYVDLGRFWQIFLLVGLFIWLGLVARALLPAFRKPKENKSLLALFLIASAAIALFYGAGIMWGRQTHLTIAEYWRWWVVHLWVEGFFEVFATVVIAFLFSRMGLVRVATATTAAIFSCTIFLAGGIIGTFHHLYFSGAPISILALGASFSALEIVPLVFIGFEAYEHLKISHSQPWVRAYRWPILFFVAVSFWNLVGAGLFGFLINPPIALYYMQGLNTTPVHGHTALFGVYGMLGIGLMLFSLKGLYGGQAWRTGVLGVSFWMINLGLATMVLLSMLPVGLIQTWASVEHGLWYARSAEFMQTDLMDQLRWMRIVGDTLFATGIMGLAWFVLGLQTGWSLRPATPSEARGEGVAVPDPA
ncbi:MAG: nitric-oxide reductase large subunit [Pirellulales bacterium]